jgi:peptidoglycan/xylan/chitin deacetylase (PgdA/CDA1 family)
MRRPASLLCLLALLAASAPAATVIRVNQLGYLPGATKVAVLMTRDPALRSVRFDLRDALTDEVVWQAGKGTTCGAYAGFPQTFRLDFSAFRREGAYVIAAAGVRSPSFRIAPDVYDGTADFLLKYLRQQRCGYNPFLRDSCHTHDGYLIYAGARDSSRVDASGGWHDASDYLRYLTTSATSAFQMMTAHRWHPEAFGDAHDHAGLPGPNGIADVLDEARWGLRWMLKMFPSDTLMLHQVADDRDHLGFRLPTEDTVNYGKRRERPVYVATGLPQGLLQYRNRSTGIASAAGKFASTFAMGAMTWREKDPAFSRLLLERARAAYELGRRHPGVCQTAPCRAPYYYEEENWGDDMELAATQLAAATGEGRYWSEALAYGRLEPVSPWLGADSARHYQWYPFVNLGHAFLARGGGNTLRDSAAAWYRAGVGRVRARAGDTPFRFGTPFNWCSNNYVSSFLAQLLAYRSLTGDGAFADMEASLRDWLFGCNPWGTSMVVGLPRDGVSPRDPHSAFTHLHGYPIDGGLVDGPVRTSIFSNLKGIHLTKEDPFREFQSDLAVYHDDWGDYSTNEPTTDGTASLTIYLSSLAVEGLKGRPSRTVSHGGVVRMDSTRKTVYLLFSGHEFGEGLPAIRKALARHRVKGSFFLTGDFYRNPAFAAEIGALRKEGHYLGPHSDRHLLYASWESRDSTLVSKEALRRDLADNYAAMREFGIVKDDAPWFLPPYEWYNGQVSRWCAEAGVRVVNMTPGSVTNADYTTPQMGSRYVSADSLLARLDRAERGAGLNGYLLLVHAGTDPARPDPLYDRLDELIGLMKKRGYGFDRLRAE